MKTLRRHIPVLVAAILVLMAASGCSKISDIRVTSYRIEKFSLKGLRGAELTLSIGVHNPTLQFTLENSSANVYRLGTLIGTIDATDVLVPARTDGNYPVTGTIRLADGMSMMKLAALAGKFDENEYSLDIFTTVKLKSGMKIRIRKLNIPLSEISSE